MRTRLSTRVLSLVLVAALLLGMMPPAHAASSDSGVTITQVDNNAVSVNPLQRLDEDSTETETYSDTDVVRVSILLQKPSTIRAGFSTLDIADNSAAMTYRAGLKEEQGNLVHRIEKATGSKLDVVWNLTLTANLISANVPYGQIETIQAQPGVQGVYLENQYLAQPVASSTVSPNMATSGAQTGSSLAWNAGYTGAGTRIAVIDTGADTDHQSLDAGAYEYSLSLLAQQKGMDTDAYIASLDLLDAKEIARVAGDLNVSIDPDAAFVNSKIPFGYNYKDLDYDITHDHDEEGEHGSHVSGIATANAWIPDGSGSYTKALDSVFVQGVSPDAQLLSMKVFGKGGSPYDSDYMAAIEDAIILGADVVNLSLGSVAPGRGTHSNPVFNAIMDDLAKSDTVVAISAGNSGPWPENAENGGYLYSTDIGFDTVGQPGSFTNSLAVASVENDGMVGYYVAVGGQMIVYNEDNRDGEFTNQPFTSIAGEHEYIFLDSVGKAEDWAAVADVLPGKIALCSRGETNFAEKATLAVEAGARAVLIYNNQSGMITLDLTEYTCTNPVAALSQVQGAMIRAASTPVTDDSGNVLYLTGTMTVSDSIGLGTFASDYYTMSDFSSWGVPGSLEMKPEITAPGGNIYSIWGSTPENNSTSKYELMSGTSMASPQVAGMSALMAQYVQENGLPEKTGLSERQLIHSLLMSTAEPLMASEGVYYPVLQQGAGLANVYDAMTAGSYLTMAPGSSSGAADGKIKVELFDDPDRTGTYSAAFTVHNLEGVEKEVSLNADFFTQAILSDGTHDYMDYTTAMLGMDVSWRVGGVAAASADMTGCDFNGDGMVSTADGQALLDFATGVSSKLSNMDMADIDGDGDIDSHDAYVFLRDLNTSTAVLPANGSIDIVVNFSMTNESRAALEEQFSNGTYIQGFLYAEVEGDTTHSIPVLGFYGNWTDPGMFDVGQWATYATGEDTRIPYIGRTRGNDFQVIYDWDRGYSYSFGGNPIIPDAEYMPERNAMNSADSMAGVSFIAIRHADQSRVLLRNETTGETIMDAETGAVNMAYYYGALGWQNSGMTLSTNFSLAGCAEDDLISMDFTLVPEYYIGDDGTVDYDALGDGATLSTSFVIDNTAPELLGVSIDLMTNTMTVKASDNNYVAAVGLYNKTGTRSLAQTGAKQDIEKGEVAEYSFSLDKVNGKKFLVQVFDYAMNRTTYLIEMQIGESVDLPEMMAYDLISYHWAGFDKTFEYNYKVGTPRIAYSDHTFYAATIAEHYVFASTNKGELYVMPEDDLTDTTYITDLGMVLYDMAYNMADGEIYAVNDSSELVSFDKLTGEIEKRGTIGVNTNTLACSPEGVFYCNELGTGKVYSFTLETMDKPELLMEDPFLTLVDPIAGADMGGTTGNMGMEFNPNTGMICWNSHCEVLVGSYITYAYYYEIDPATGEFTRYNDFWHEMAGLIIPVRTGADNSWASPTDKISAVKLNKSQIDVIQGTTAQLSANVQPWTATDRTVTWSSSDDTVATVDKNGVVTGLKEGTAVIRATSNLDPDFYGECTVNVEILDVTIHGTLSDAEGNSMFYDWDMSTGESWKGGAALPTTMTSVTYSDTEKVFYMMDANSGSWMMHKVAADGTVLASAENTNNIPLWDMAYNPYFSQVHGEEQVSSIYYYYLLSPKDPMNMNAVGFDMGNMTEYLVGITTAGYEQQTDADGNVYDTEHLILLDNAGYVWDFWIYDQGDGMNALFNITDSTLNCEFPGDETLDNMYTSLMLGEDGNLYLSAFNGSTNEIWYMAYNAEENLYEAVKLGDVGADVWPASITSVTVNGEAQANAASPKPAYTMAAKQISVSELKVAAISGDEAKYGLIANDAGGSKTDTIALTEGANQMDISKMVYYSFTPDENGTVSLNISTSTNKWYAMYYPNGADGSYTTLDSTQPDAVTVTAGSQVILGIRIYESSKWSAAAGTLTIDVDFTPAGGSTEPDPSEPVDPDPTDPEPSEPVEQEDTLVLGTNALVSGTEYTYTAAVDGRLEFDFVVKDSEDKTIYQYAYGKGTRLDILINGNRIENLAGTKISVSAGDKVTVQLQSVDGGEYTATLTMAALEAAAKLELGDNSISKDTDYSFIAPQDGTLYTTIKELWYDGTYCTEVSLSSTLVFKINGVAVSKFQNSYEVNAGDEITVSLGLSFGSESASAVLNLSYDGFYNHPIGSRGNPYILDYAAFPTTTVEIPAGEAVWYKLTGFYSGYYMDIYGENAYVIVGRETYTVSANGLRIPAVTSLQIGNAGTEPAAFELYAGIYEGTSGNPKDLVEGEQTTELGKSENFYYDYTAAQAGTATFTVSGDNWRFWYSLLSASGSCLVEEEDHQARRDDSGTMTVKLTAGQSIVLKLGTLDSSFTAPGGAVTVDFHFQPDEAEVPENLLVLGKNDLTSGVKYGYVVPADGRMEFSVGSVYNSSGSKQYGWYNGSRLNILINGKAMTASSAKMNVTAGQIITVEIESLDSDTYTADMTLAEVTPASKLILGQNELEQDLEYVYTAVKNGTVYISVIEMLYNGEPVTVSALGSTVQMTINGTSVSTFDKSVEVSTGDEIALILKDYSWDGSGEVSATIHLSYQGFFEHPAGSLVNPVELKYADCPTDSIEIPSGTTVWYELEGDPGDYSTPSNYPFKGKYLVVAGANASIIVDSTVYNAENGVAKVLIGEQTMIQIGNNGSSAAVFGISVEVPEGHVDNPQDLAEGENKITLPSYGTHYFDFTANDDGTATVAVSGENWKYTFTHYAADGTQISTMDRYAKNGDEATVTQAMKAGERIVVMVGTAQGYTQPGGDITVTFHFEGACAHAQTEIRGAVKATCTAPGYTGDTYCTACGKLMVSGTEIPALGHDYHDGVCSRCGEEDPDKSVVIEVVNAVDATNGVVTVTWDPAKLTLMDLDIHADFTSVKYGEGTVTFGYVSLIGIPAGRSMATLTFEAVNKSDADVTIEHKQINNEPGEVVVVNPFVDVPEDSFYYDAVMWAVENDITNGTSENTFGPNLSGSRAHVVTFLWRAAGQPKSASSENPFVDVSEDAFYYDAVLWAVEKGITDGVNATHFAPDLECSRAQIVTFLWRAAGHPKPASNENPFVDVTVDAFYYDAVLWAVEMGITEGMDATHFSPLAICNRAQIVIFLYRAYA